MVSLFAATKQKKTAHINVPLKKDRFVIRTGMCHFHKKTATVNREKKLLHPAMAIGFQGINLMKIPAILQRDAQMTICKMALFFCFRYDNEMLLFLSIDSINLIFYVKNVLKE